MFEFWLEPRLFCREALSSPVGKEFTRQMNVVIDHAHSRELQVEMIVALATVGEKWRTLCPNLADEWRELRFLWDAWIRRFPGLDIAGIFPGDPGACSRNGCTAETYIDKSICFTMTAVSLFGLILAGLLLPSAQAADMVTVRPQEIDDVLVNPGIGFTTFQRYRKFPLALRLKNGQHTEVLLTDADITTWLPGDTLCDRSIPVAGDFPAGDYELALAILDSRTKLPNVRLAIAGRTEDGWYPLGTINVERGPGRIPSPN